MVCLPEACFKPLENGMLQHLFDRAVIFLSLQHFIAPALDLMPYRKDTEPFYHYFMYSLVSLLSGIYLLHAMHSLLCYIIFDGI